MGDFAKRNDIAIGVICALICEVIYGMSYMFTKQATANASSLSLLGWRFLMAFIVMSLLVGVGALKVQLKGKNIKPLLLIALFSPVIYFIGETVGITNTTASESGVFLACIPVASIVASTLILKNKPTGFQIVGILITLVGVIITVVAVGISSSLSIIGYLFLLIAVVSYALYSVFVEKAADYTGAEITYIMLIAGMLVFVILAVMEGWKEGNLSALAVLPFRNHAFLMAILYQGIGCSVCAFFLSNVAISKLGVNRVSSFVGISTVVSILAGAVFLKETFSLYQIVGAVVIIAGVYTANVNMLRKHENESIK